MKRLRIRQRSLVSEVNVDFKAGHFTGTQEGYAKGKAHTARLYDNKIREMEEEVRELQKKLRKEEISFGQLAHKHNEKVGECLRLSQEVAMLRAREDLGVHSDMLFLPPFEVKATPWKDPEAVALREKQLPPTRAKAERIEALRRMYGGSPIGAMTGEGRSLLRDWQRDPEMVRQFRNQMDRAFNMPSPGPPGNPMVHVDFAQAESRTMVAMLRDTHLLDSRRDAPVDEENVRAVNEAALRTARRTQIPFQIGSRERTAEEQDNIERDRVRRASVGVEDVTDREGGHSHTLQVGMELAPELREALESLERFREAFGNAGISAETMVRMLDRLVAVEERLEEQAPSSESEAQDNAGDRSSAPREEQAQGSIGDREASGTTQADPRSGRRIITGR